MEKLMERYVVFTHRPSGNPFGVDAYEEGATGQAESNLFKA